MSKGTYDHQSHAQAAQGRASQTREQTFKNTRLDPMMDIRTKGFRESLWVPPYDRARPIYVSLDVTGSMGHIPQYLATDPHGLPGMVKGIYPFMEFPQIACMAVDDSRCGSDAPLQVGHIEGEGHLMDKWLTSTYIVGGGGGNGGESYELGMYVAARMTRADCFAHGLKGYNFIIGDDGWFPSVRAMDVQEICGEKITADIPTEQIVAELNEHWHTFFLIPDAGRAAIAPKWRQLLGDNVIVCATHEDISLVIPGLIGITEGTLDNLDDYDRIMRDDLGRDDQAQRRRVISTLEAYAATRGRAGAARDPDPVATPAKRRSGNARPTA